MLWPLLCFVTFIAATVQSALGFGFGLIAVAAFVVLFDSAQAIQLVIILTFLMSLAHYPKLKLRNTGALLKPLIYSSLLGFPVGIWVYLSIDLSLLKTLIAILLISLSGLSLYHIYQAKQPVSNIGPQSAASPFMISLVGMIAGAMATSLAMPGPLVMLYLSSQRLEKDLVRALMSGFFIFSYFAALICQWLLVGIDLSTWKNALLLLPFALLGTYVGHHISRKISQQFFQRLVLIILVSSGLFMLFNQ
ncbi:MAG: sulfite exporter TauE/SafE family protein [Oceanospirillaceae bacterium]|nr:sulfite exporter TauE/SafE family protein [Oceanospirillaceae bacterium]